MTYGPHAHVSGVTISHLASGTLAIEVHIVVAQAAISVADATGDRSAAMLRAQSMPVLLHLAGRVRGAVYDVLRRYGERPSTVDISIDDLQ